MSSFQREFRPRSDNDDDNPTKAVQYQVIIIILILGSLSFVAGLALNDFFQRLLDTVFTRRTLLSDFIYVLFIIVIVVVAAWLAYRFYPAAAHKVFV